MRMREFKQQSPGRRIIRYVLIAVLFTMAVWLHYVTGNPHFLWLYAPGLGLVWVAIVVITEWGYRRRSGATRTPAD